jgi:hypothetical protein
MCRSALALALLAALSSTAASLDCRALGFSGFALCSSCDALENAVHDAGAVARRGFPCAALAELSGTALRRLRGCEAPFCLR